MWNRNVVTFALFFALLGTYSEEKLFLVQQPLPTLDQLGRESTYIFLGTVKRTRASTVSLLPADDSTVVVRVDAVLHAPALLADYTRQEVTVELREAKSVAEGQRLVFFTNGGLFGKGIALKEVGHLKSVAGAANEVALLRGQIAQVLQRKADEDLGRRMASAELVVSGKIIESHPAKLGGRSPVTEHDPEWREAEVLIQSLEKGQYAGQTVSVLYANSLDYVWARAPKLKAGEEGIFILHRNEVKWPGIENSYTLVDPSDVQLSSRLERVRQILKGAL